MKNTIKTFLIGCACLLMSSSIWGQDALIEKGKELLGSGDHAGALAALDEAIGEDESNGKAYFYRGKVKSATQDDKGALADYNSAISNSFENGELYRLKAMSEHLTGNEDAACSDFSKAIELGDLLSEQMKTRFCE